MPNGPWPAGDQKGMANTLGAGTLAQVFGSYGQHGFQVYELNHVRSNTMPASPFGRPLSYTYTPSVSIPGTRHVFNGEQVNGG